MRKAIKTVRFFLVLLGGATLPLSAGPVVIAAQSQVTPAQAPQDQNEHVAKGQLVGLDPDKNTLTIRLADDTEMQFTYDEDTRVVGTQDGIQGLSDGKPTMVAVHYTQDEQSHNTAKIVEILP